MPKLSTRAVLADEYWAGRLPALVGSETTHSYRGLYAVVYRQLSAVDHASVMGLGPVVVDLPDGSRRVELGTESQGMDPVGNARLLLAWSLYVAAETLGWPDRDSIDDAFARVLA
jgi:hypothetical protein